MAAAKPWRNMLGRLARMNWQEIGTRGLQGIAKRWDLALYRLGFHLDRTRSRISPQPPPSFFFASSNLPLLAVLIRERLPQDVEQIIEEANRVRQHRFDLLGYQAVDYGPEIDWHFDAVHGKRVPRRPWFKIRDGFEEIGDTKVTWELNRHQHLVTLAKAYRYAQDERFAAELFRQWYGWQEKNPYPIGINWASSLEVALRSLSWLWVRHLLAGCPAAPQSFENDLLRALGVNGRHIERYLSTYYSPNTHLLGEGVGLFFIGTLCPELPAAPRWQQLGWEIVMREAERQVQPDGMHFEQSTYYHVYALDFFLHARTLASCNQIPIPDSFDRTIERMLEILLALGQAGPPPRFGDDDGGRVFNPRRNRAEHLLDPLATGAIIFKRGDFKAEAGGVREETLWLLGARSLAQFDQLPQLRPSMHSRRFEASGICVMASSEPVQQLVVDAGPQGAMSAGHGHADALTLHMAVEGREWLIDPGTFCYASSGAERNFFRGTAAHNTLQVDGLDQAEPIGPFAWRSLPSVQLEKWTAGETFDLFRGSHTGYCRLPDPVVHRRWVFGLKSRFFFVRDLALGRANHQLDLFWHLAPGFLLRSSTANTVFLWTRQPAVAATFSSPGEREGLSLLPVQGHGWSQETVQGEVSPVYGEEVSAPVLHFGTRATLPTEFAILVRPVRGAVEEQGILARMQGARKAEPVQGYRYEGPEECHCIFFAEPGKEWSLGSWASDAELMYYGVGPEGRGHWVLCGGSYAEVDGQRVVSCSRAVERCEWNSGQGAKRLSCSDESALTYVSDRAIGRL
jgi:hypothetical protein